MTSPRESGGVYRLKPELNEPDGTTPSPTVHQRPLEPSSTRTWLLFGFMVLAGCTLTARLVWYQFKGPIPSASANEQQVDPTLSRGTITDRNGYPLAMDLFSYRIVADPKLIGPENFEAVAQAYAPLLGVSAEHIFRTLQENAQRRDAELAMVDLDTGAQIAGDPYYTVTAQIRPRTIFPETFMAAQVLGYVDSERHGQYGLEAKYDDFLRVPTAFLRALPTPQFDEPNPELAKLIANSEFLPSAFQHDLILSLDRVIQYIAEENLRHAVEEFEAEGGTVIVMDPHSGAILAMANWPTFDPNRFSDFSARKEVFTNPAVDAFYEPGSVFKLITYAAALEKEVITPETIYLDEAEFVYYEQVVKNWDERGHGEVTTTEALAQSLNVVAAKIAIDLGASEFYKAVSRFGFGQTTGIDLPNELPGIVTNPHKSGWVPGSLATNSFGQGISVTPLQMANAVATIADGGVRHRAFIVQALIKDGHVRVIAPQAQSRAISTETAAELTEMMVTTVQHIPAAIIPGYRIAGKSGTAQIPNPVTGKYEKKVTNTTFVGFLPADDPQFVILAKLNRPRSNTWASKTAANLFRAVAHDLIINYGIPKDTQYQPPTVPANPQ